MTRILTTTALVLAMATPALANDMLRQKVDEKLEASAQEVDVSALTDEQVRALYAGLSSDNSAAERNALIESIVADPQYRMDDTVMGDYGNFGADNDLRNVVADMLANEPVDVDVSQLTDAQISALYLELTSGEATDATRIESIVEQ